MGRRERQNRQPGRPDAAAAGAAQAGQLPGPAPSRARRPADRRRAEPAADASSLTLAPGVGKQSANRLVLEREGKLPAPEEAPAAAASPPAAEDAVSALINLGYPEASARKAVDKALADLGPETGVEKLLRESLKRF